MQGYNFARAPGDCGGQFDPHRTVVKMFVIKYDLSDMPANSQTFLRQKTLYMPADSNHTHTDAQKWLRYLIHLR